MKGNTPVATNPRYTLKQVLPRLCCTILPMLYCLCYKIKEISYVPVPLVEDNPVVLGAKLQVQVDRVVGVTK